jgi:hypothetical protein
MNREQATKELVEDLMFHGCQKLTCDLALELAESILDNKVPFISVRTSDDFKENVAIQAAKNKEVMIEVMSNFLPKDISADEALNQDMNYWKNIFISSCLCAGKSVEDSIEHANRAVTEIYKQVTNK